MRDCPTIYFIRHGETDWNRDRRYQGRRDIPLNETGRTQARRNGRALRTFLPEIASARFIASPMQRTRETMEIIRAELDLPVGGYQTDPDLVELSYGQWEGTLQADLAALDPKGLTARQADPFRWRPEGGESYADLFARVERWARTVTDDVVVVSHGGVSRCLRGHLLALDPLGIPDLESPQDRVLIFANATMRWL